MERRSQLRELEQQFRDLAAQVTCLVQAVSQEQLVARPKRFRWSIADCIAHLHLTSCGYLALLAPVLGNAGKAADAENADGAAYRMDLAGRFMKWSIEPPYRIRVRTTSDLLPQSFDPQSLLKDFLQSQSDLIGMIHAAGGLPLEHIKIVSPLSRHMRYNAFSCFHILAAHQRRHIWQARQIRGDLS
jgi:hypothetical protein